MRPDALPFPPDGIRAPGVAQPPSAVSPSPAAALRGRDLTVRTYQLRADSINEEERSVEAVIATEKPVTVLDLRDWRIIDEVLRMDGCEIPDSQQVPMLDTHQRWSVDTVLGSTRNLRTQGGKLLGLNVFSAADEGERSFLKVREGHLTDNSIGYRVLDSAEIPAGKSATVNGKKYRAGARTLRITTRWRPGENSICPIGADVAAKMREESGGTGPPAPPPPVSQERRTTMSFEEWLQKRGLSLDGLDEARRAELEAEYRAEHPVAPAAPPVAPPPPPAPPVQRTEPPAPPQASAADLEAARAEGARLERERVAAIRAEAEGVTPETVERAIREDMSLDAARAAFLADIRAARTPSVGSPAVQTRESAFSQSREVFEAALLVRGGLADEVATDELRERGDRLRDFSLVDICRAALRMDGIEEPMSRREMIRAAFSTVSLPQLLGNVANKSLMKGYLLAAATWRAWCTIGSVSDFKTITKARLTDTGELEVVNTAGEVPHGGATEEYEQYSVATYAKQLTITRQHIINDDLSVFTRVPQRMGAAAQMLIGKLVYTHLLANGTMQDGTALFASGHSNLVTGAGYKLSAGAAALRKALETFRKQTNSAGDPIEVDPAVLLACPEDEEYARALLKSIKLAEGTTAGLPTANIWGDLGIKPAVESRLSNTGYSGYSATAWYLMGRPGVIDTVEVAFLNGQQNPTIERFSQKGIGIDVLGIGYRVYLDVGVKALDWRGMVKLDGA